MTRILLFIATNLAVMVLISITFQILGIEGLLAENGADLNLYALLVMSAVIGFGGAFISLAISKWSAKRFMGVHVIETATNQQEQWLLDIVTRQAPQVGIGMPEVGIFQSDDINAFSLTSAFGNENCGFGASTLVGVVRLVAGTLLC
jgi:heat shock protein HtpX